MKTTLFIILLCIITIVLCFSEQPGVFTLAITPGGVIPFPVTISGIEKDYFLGSGGAGLKGEYILPFAPAYIIGGGIDYILAPINTEVTTKDSPFSFITVLGELGLIFQPAQNIFISLVGTPGCYLMIFEGEVGSGPFWGGEASIYYQFSKNFSMGICGSYKNYWSIKDIGPGFHGLSINLGIRINFTEIEKSKLEIEDTMFVPVFPVFYSYYDENPIGEVSFRNNEKGNIKDVKISLYVKQYMDSPKLCKVFKELKTGEEVSTPLYALFTKDVFDITEGTKVMAQILIEYRYMDRNIEKEEVKTIEIRDRNAMTWDDERKAAAFVTAKDPTILKYSKGIESAIRETGTKSVNENFRNALALFESLAIFGLTYSIDPSTPYAKFSNDETVIDFLQFPIQTLMYKAGDCDDMAILFCAMLEAIGIETAFITVPEHILMAFALKMDPSDAISMFLNPDDLIAMDLKVWIPVESTMISQGFLKAWSNGAKTWRENKEKESAAFFPIHDAWSMYNPVGILSGDPGIAIPKNEEVVKRYEEVLNRFIKKEIAERVKELEISILESENNVEIINKLGILYAQFGLFDKAIIEFEKILAIEELPAALISLGNIYYINKDFKKARFYYERAYKVDINNKNTLLSLAKVMYALGDFAKAGEFYEKLKEICPELAEKYAYIELSTLGGVKSGQNWLQENVNWVE